jgi:hypothetical protein
MESNNEPLKDLQLERENLTMKYDHQNIFTQVPQLVKILIEEDQPSAKELIFSRKDIDDKETEVVNKMDTYTFEAIIRQVLA